MLNVVVESQELWDDEKQEFVDTKPITLQLEHSLVSLSKWESKWEVPFLSDDKLTDEQTLDYVRAMNLTPGVPDEVFDTLSSVTLTQINEYIRKKMTASTITEAPSKNTKKEVITAELMYYWMVALNIPWEAQHWHLNRLIMLVRVINAKNTPAKSNRVGKAEQLRSRAELNRQRQMANQSPG